MKIYGVAFFRQGSEHIDIYHYFSEIKKAQNYLTLISKRYPSYCVLFDKENKLWNLKVSPSIFYSCNFNKDDFYDKWFITEIEVE